MKTIDLQAADNIRALAVAMVEKAKSGHPGGPMGGADFMHILYSEYLRFDPENGNWHARDRFFMDAGHLSSLMYAQYSMLGKFSMEELSNFRQWKSPTPGHPEVDPERLIENTSGPLGQGHVMGVGAAIAAKFLQAKFGDWMDQKIYGFISDGGIQEEISQGAGRIAGHLGLSNFIMFFDSNDVQLSTMVDEVTTEDTAMKYEAWGWKVITIDAHNHDEIRKALDEANAETEKPTLIIGKTIMGKGCVTAEGEMFEGHCELHGQPIGNTGADYVKTLENLGANPEDPFQIFSDVKEKYAAVIEKKRLNAKKAQAVEAKWRKSEPKLAAKLDQFFTGELPEGIDWSEIEQKAGVATRAAGSAVLGYLADKVENMIVSSADLSNSDKTDGFLKKTRSIQKDDFGGAFLQAGVAELTMAAIANGMALHGGVIPVVGTFFVFSDYMKPAIRLGAIQELAVKYVWTHDAFRVGEDGPTHQPIEQEAQIRLMEKVKNHSGKNSFLALRPADANEATVAWKMALENTEVSTGLILSRQGIKDLPSEGSRYEDALKAERGGYIVKSVENPDVILVANGSEVSTLVAGAELLESEGIKSNIVSVISEGLFRTQDEAYQVSVIPTDKPVFGLTAGLPANLEGLVGPKGKVFGLDHFGWSAPAGVLDEKFGFTGENVKNQVLELLGK
ncbi:transketolase family protein [Reichenbachiella versicolor]|uniref:transketolase family protein n=1 Tax=Reichenbachiella versicolor TaxID=1821036 RepID=UPI000D6DFF76|nr:transketolase [Reichenbachiella versicolor]